MRFSTINYFAIAAALGCGALYAESEPVEAVEVCCVKEVAVQTVEEQLAELFGATELTKVVIEIDGHKVGLSYNPEGGSQKVSNITDHSALVLVSEKPIPADVMRRINLALPQGVSFSTFSFGSVNGQPTFVALGYEEA